MANQARAKHHRNMVLKVKRYDLGNSREGCYPGTVEGEVVGGSLHGRNVTVSLNRTHTNEQVEQLWDLGGPEADQPVPPGGYLAFNTVREQANDFRANGGNRFAGPEDELRVNVPIQIAPILELGGGIRRFKSNNATMYRAFILQTDEATTARFTTDITEAARKIFVAEKAAFVVSRTHGGDRETSVLWRGWDDGQPVPVDQSLVKHFNSGRKDTFTSLLRKGAHIEVMPLESVFVSPTTAESIDNGIFSKIAIREYCTGGIGHRIETTLRNSKLDDGTLQDHFYKSLDKFAQGAFDKYGWQGLWTSDIENYIRKQEMEPPQLTTFGYALSTAVIKKYKAEKGRESRFVTKTRYFGPAVPREFVPTPSDPDAETRFEEGFVQLVRDLHAGIKREQEPKPSGQPAEQAGPTP